MRGASILLNYFPLVRILHLYFHLGMLVLELSGRACFLVLTFTFSNLKQFKAVFTVTHPLN